MKSLWLLCAAGMVCIVLCADKEEQYQDIVVNNVVVSKGVRECASRYEALRPILDKYKRPITVLDIGASQGYFSFRIANDYDATCVMIEGNYDKTWKIADRLFELCTLNGNLHSIIFLKKKITPEELERLASCEHFDVVLAFNVLHHFGSQWKRATDAVLNLGDNIIIETPPAQDKVVSQKQPSVRPLETYLLGQNGKLMLEVQRHTDPNTKGKMLWFERNKTFLERPHWFVKANTYRTWYTITSTYTDKIITKNRIQKTYCWKRGINLLTFKMLNGVFPTQEVVKKNFIAFSNYNYGDLLPWNMVIQGETVELIDQDDNRYHLDPKESLDFSLKLLAQEKPEHVWSFFTQNIESFLKGQKQNISQWYGINYTFRGES